jgi:hypothetical protein
VAYGWEERRRRSGYVPPGEYVLEVRQVTVVLDFFIERFRVNFGVLQGPFEGRRFDVYLDMGHNPKRILKASIMGEIIDSTIGSTRKLAEQGIDFDPEEHLDGYRITATIARDERRRGVWACVVPGSVNTPPLFIEPRAEQPRDRHVYPIADLRKARERLPQELDLPGKPKLDNEPTMGVLVPLRGGRA